MRLKFLDIDLIVADPLSSRDRTRIKLISLRSIIVLVDVVIRNLYHQRWLFRHSLIVSWWDASHPEACRYSHVD